MRVYFLIRNQNNTPVLFNLSEKNRGMNKGMGIKSIYCFCSGSVWVEKSRNWLFLM